jgi:hypothetical protein
LQHQKLKKLQISLGNGEINHDFAKLIGCCTKLEDFSAVTVLTKGTLKKIFTLQPNLKSFKILCFILSWKNFPLVTQADIAAIKENGKKLENFKLNYCIFEDGISPENLQEEFNDQFDTIEENLNSYNSTYSWKMEKTSKQS